MLDSLYFFLTTIKFRNSAPLRQAPRRWAPLKKLTKPDRPIKHTYTVSMDKFSRRYALQKNLTKLDRPRASSRIFTVLRLKQLKYRTWCSRYACVYKIS